MLSKNKMLAMYEHLVLTRTFEDWIFYICHNQDHKNPVVVGKGYLSTGQEAISVGAAHALDDGDWMAPSHRDVGAHFVSGMTLQDLLLQYMGRQGSPTKGRDGNIHLGLSKHRTLGFISHMGAMTAPACGVAFAMKYRGHKNAVLAFYGDGAAQQGVVHEALNYAAVQKLPVVFIINNNRWAISTPIKDQVCIENLADRALGYGMPSSICEGNNVFEVHQHVLEAMHRAKRGEGPTMVECKSMRMSGHGTYDMAKYVPTEEFEAWKKKDPIQWAERILRDKGVATDADFKRIKEETKAKLHAEVEIAMQQPQVQWGPQEFKDVYAD